MGNVGELWERWWEALGKGDGARGSGEHRGGSVEVGGGSVKVVRLWGWWVEALGKVRDVLGKVGVGCGEGLRGPG
jgi:hypothetical protein